MIMIIKCLLPAIDSANRYSTRYSDFLSQPYSNPTRSHKTLLAGPWSQVAPRFIYHVLVILSDSSWTECRQRKNPYLADIICGQTMRNNLSQPGIVLVFFLHVIFQQIMNYCWNLALTTFEIFCSSVFSQRTQNFSACDLSTGFEMMLKSCIGNIWNTKYQNSVS